MRAPDPDRARLDEQELGLQIRAVDREPHERDLGLARTQPARGVAQTEADELDGHGRIALSKGTDDRRCEFKGGGDEEANTQFSPHLGLGATGGLGTRVEGGESVAHPA